MITKIRSDNFPDGAVQHATPKWLLSWRGFGINHKGELGNDPLLKNNFSASDKGCVGVLPPLYIEVLQEIDLGIYIKIKTSLT